LVDLGTVGPSEEKDVSYSLPGRPYDALFL